MKSIRSTLAVVFLAFLGSTSIAWGDSVGVITETEGSPELIRDGDVFAAAAGDAPRPDAEKAQKSAPERISNLTLQASSFSHAIEGQCPTSETTLETLPAATSCAGEISEKVGRPTE